MCNGHASLCAFDLSNNFSRGSQKCDCSNTMGAPKFHWCLFPFPHLIISCVVIFVGQVHEACHFEIAKNHQPFEAMNMRLLFAIFEEIAANLFSDMFWNDGGAN